MNLLKYITKRVVRFSGIRSFEMSNVRMLEPVGYQWLDTGHFRKNIPKGCDVSAFRELVTVEQAEAHCAALRQALHDLVRDLEMRSAWKEGKEQGVVDCGNGVYMKAKAALGEL